MVLETSTLPTELYPYIRAILYQKNSGLSRAFLKKFIKTEIFNEFSSNYGASKTTGTKFRISSELSVTSEFNAYTSTPCSFAMLNALANSG